MHILNVCTKKVYEEKNGEKKIKWYRAGILKVSDAGKMYLQLFHQPQTEFFIFEKEKPLPEIQLEK